MAQSAAQVRPNVITGPQYVLKTEVPLAPPSTLGSNYFDETWQSAEIMVKTDLLVKDLSARIELEHAMVEFKVNDQVRHLALRDVEYVKLITPQNTTLTFKRASAYTFEGVRLEGVAQVMADGRFGVIKQHSVELLQSNYNVALDVGSRDHRRIKKERIFLSYDNKLLSVKGSSKKLVAQLNADDRSVAESIIKDHDLRISDEEDLQQFALLMNERSK